VFIDRTDNARTEVSYSGRQKKEKSSEEEEVGYPIQQGGKSAPCGRILHPDSFYPRIPFLRHGQAGV
jgi:hypothetical protein